MSNVVSIRDRQRFPRFSDMDDKDFVYFLTDEDGNITEMGYAYWDGNKIIRRKTREDELQ